MHIFGRDGAEQWEIVARAIKRLETENRRAAIVLVLVVWYRRSVASVAGSLRLTGKEIGAELKWARRRLRELIRQESVKHENDDPSPSAAPTGPLAANGDEPPKGRPRPMGGTES